MKNNIIATVSNVFVLCIIIGVVSLYFLQYTQLSGFIFLGLGILCLLSLLPFQIPLRSIWPDIIFGVIDNGILVLLAIIGGEMAGVIGAVLGGAVGNAITDGIAGVFEGYTAEKMRKNNVSDERTILGSAVGKMAGCLFGAGVVLIVANVFNF